MNQDKEKTLLIKWEIEDYLYENNFSLDRIGAYRNKLYKKDILLEAPNFLYKFYNTKKFNLESLVEGYLYFSNPRVFNDPFDCLTNREEYILKGGEGIVNHRNNLGVCSFTLTNENPLMWGHYTNNYKGFCVKFKNNDLFKNHSMPLTHVSYLKDYQPVYRNYDKIISDLYEIDSLDEEVKIEIHRILNIIHHYGWKYYDWHYEKEFRAISLNTNIYNRKLKIDKENISEIYFGHRMKDLKPKFYEELWDIINRCYPKIDVYEVKPNPLVVRLDFNKLHSSK